MNPYKKISIFFYFLYIEIYAEFLSSYR